ncbi:hypothetical protein [Psychrobacillus psychrodurans]|uniref:hypothetical protein n=1 Tax=Psychrobacillus psychrodurans TaxID=126157 RepID=UPI003D0304A0
MDNYHKNNYKNNNKKNTDEDYINEFVRVTSKSGKNLTKRGFDEDSHLSSMSIIKGLKKSWKQLIVEFNKLEELYDYVIIEYQKYAYQNGKANSTNFVREHHYMGQYLFSDVLDIKLVRKAGGFINSNYNGMYNDYLLKEHFNKVMEKLKHIPSVSEFLKHGDILPSIYCDYYGVKGQQWDKVLEIMIEDEAILESYIRERDSEYTILAINSLKEYSLKNRIPEAVLEKEFRRVFDYFYENYGTHPTRRLFNKHSIFNDMTYRKRHEIRWSEVIKFYGYTPRERNVSEKVFLEILKKVLNCDYQRNKTFPWLLGVRGKHLFCDGYFVDLNLIVEFDGKHHRVSIETFGGYERFIRVQQNDAIKEQYVKVKGFKFLRVSSKENWENVEYLKKRLRVLDIDV